MILNCRRHDRKCPRDLVIRDALHDEREDVDFSPRQPIAIHRLEQGTARAARLCNRDVPTRSVALHRRDLHDVACALELEFTSPRPGGEACRGNFDHSRGARVFVRRCEKRLSRLGQHDDARCSPTLQDLLAHADPIAGARERILLDVVSGRQIYQISWIDKAIRAMRSPRFSGWQSRASMLQTEGRRPSRRSLWNV